MGSRLSNGEVMRGIFIKHILADSPAGQNGTLKTGDRIVEVKEFKSQTLRAVLVNLKLFYGAILGRYLIN